MYVFLNNFAAPAILYNKVATIIHLDVYYIIIDWKACLQQLSGDKTLLMELLSLLASDFKAAKETLKKAYAAHDNNALRAELHRVSGGLSYLTLPQVNKALSDFHEAVKATPQDSHHLEYTYNQLLHHIQLFCMALEEKPSQ